MNDALQAEIVRAACGPITVDITTTGRKSGQPRRIEIWIVAVGDRVIIGGTPRRRDWLANLQADPSMVVHFKEHAVFDAAATAAEVTNGAVRREIWEHLSTQWYRGQTPVDELIATAPTVELTFVGLPEV